VSTWVLVVDWDEVRVSAVPYRRGIDCDGAGGTFCDAGVVTAGLLLATASMSDIVHFSAASSQSRHDTQEESQNRSALHQIYLSMP